MRGHPSRRRYFLTAMAGSLIGVLIGVLLVSVIPAIAANGDALVAGAVNKAGRSTRLLSRGPSVLHLSNTGGNPALRLKTGPGVAPMEVDSDTRVANLNADLLDNRQGSQYRIRAASCSNDNIPDKAAWIDCSVTVEVPTGGGTLVMSGSVDAWGVYTMGAGAIAQWATCGFRVDGTRLRYSERQVSIDPEEGGICSSDAARAVPGGSHTVNFRLGGPDLSIADAFFAPGSGAFYVIMVPN